MNKDEKESSTKDLEKELKPEWSICLKNHVLYMRM